MKTIYIYETKLVSLKIYIGASMRKMAQSDSSRDSPRLSGPQWSGLLCFNLCRLIIIIYTKERQSIITIGV